MSGVAKLFACVSSRNWQTLCVGSSVARTLAHVSSKD